MTRTAVFLILVASFALIAKEACADAPLPRGHYTLTGVEVVPINRVKANGKTKDDISDILTYWVRFDIHTKYTLEEGTKAKPFEITNPTIRSKCSITVDKPILFKGEELPAGTNLIKYQKFDGKFLNVSMHTLSPLVINSVFIRDDFRFPPDTYTLTFEWETADGTKISDTVTVRIDIASERK